MECYLCKCRETNLLHHGTRDNPEVDVLQCPACGLVFLTSLGTMTEEFYENSGMHVGKKMEDWCVKTAPDDERRYQQWKEKLRGKTVLDFGCGNGGFLRRIQEVAQEVAGVEMEAIAREFMRKNDTFPIYRTMDECEIQYDYIMSFHVIEHIEDPEPLLREMRKHLKPGGEIILETPNAEDALLSLYESEAYANFTYWSKHVYLYAEKTMFDLAHKAGLSVNYMQQYQRYPLANHLYWLAQGKPGGGKLAFLELRDEEMEKRYADLLAKQKKCDTLICSLS